MQTTMKTTALAGWFGANRILAAQVGKELAGCEWVGVPFAGGMSELAYIKARTILVNDRHSHVINLAQVARDAEFGPKLYRHLRRLPFHPDILAEAQERCALRESAQEGSLFAKKIEMDFYDRLEWAVDYFTCCWMGRGGSAGTDGEFNGGLSLRYDAGGGDSNTRFRSAAHSLMAWRKIFQRCNFFCEDAFDFIIKRVKDRAGHALYCDPPWPDAGDSYCHKFTIAQQRQLATVLSKFQQTRVVIRFGVHPLIEELYPRDAWIWKEQTSRAQSNGDVKEALIINCGPLRA